jgi:hypothetical protein
MAHFAKLGINSKVIAVHALDNNKLLNADSVEDEAVGQQELQRLHGWPSALWIKTSYNTRGKNTTTLTVQKAIHQKHYEVTTQVSVILGTKITQSSGQNNHTQAG